MSIIAEQAKSKDHGKIVTPGPGIMYVPKLKPKHKTPQVDVKNKGLRIWIFFVNAQWWMNILEWIDLNPIVFGGWASPLISSSFLFFWIVVYGCFPFLHLSFVYLKKASEWQDFPNKNGCCVKGYFSLVLFCSIWIAHTHKKKQFWR